MSVSTDQVMEVVERLRPKGPPKLEVKRLDLGTCDPYEGEMLFTFWYTREGSRHPITQTLSLNIYLTSLPGGCGGLIIHNPSGWTGEGVAISFFLDVVMEVIREKAIEYGDWGKYIIASTVSDQKPFIAWLQKNKFTVTGRSTNPRTENRMTFWGKDLKPRRVRKPVVTSVVDVAPVPPPQPQAQQAAHRFVAWQGDYIDFVRPVGF